MSSRHSIVPRGLNAPRSSLSQGRFGRMFRNLAPAKFGPNEADNIANLATLADNMIGNDGPKDGPDAEESGIPSLYTYFGQFIDHDITFDPVSSLTKQQDPDGLVDFRTPALDLDNLYGRGPGDQPYLYDDHGKFLLGNALTGAGAPASFDLPRAANQRALIGDPRNDENSIVSQLQGLFLRFHNRMVDDNPGLSFQDVQQRVRFHYQYVVMNDFLPRLVHANVLNALRDDDGRYDRSQIKYYHWHTFPFMPVEFSVAAYRLGHSMIRPGYRLNDDKLLPVFPIKPGEDALTGFQTMGEGRAIDWGRFIDIDRRAYGVEDQDGNPDNKKRLQFAYRIDTSLVEPLGKLPPSVASDRPPSLAQRNLERGWRLGLPSGQSVARAMHLQPLHDSKIIIGKAVDKPGPTDPQIGIGDIANGVFKGNCPLWAYVLAEARYYQASVPIPADGAPGPINTPQLGPVGGRIVAEVFLGLLFGDNFSLLSLDPNWKPVTGPDFALKDIVAYALGQGPALH